MHSHHFEFVINDYSKYELAQTPPHQKAATRHSTSAPFPLEVAQFSYFCGLSKKQGRETASIRTAKIGLRILNRLWADVKPTQSFNLCFRQADSLVGTGFQCLSQRCFQIHSTYTVAYRGLNL